jgi:hypothetical protein
MFKLMIAGAIMGAAATGAGAVQYVTDGGLAGSVGTVYSGPGFGAFGSVSDGGRDAFDSYGYYPNALAAGLTQTRLVEAFTARNLYRFFDTFTNTTSDAISTTLVFSGNLGSDAATLEEYGAGGLIVSCQSGAIGCASDPVVASIAGNNGLGHQLLNGDDYFASFDVTIAAGASISLLNFAFVASEDTGTQASDVTLAIATGQSLVANPFLDGLSTQQIAQIANYDFGTPGVPEPAAWVMMISGFGMAGAMLRRQRPMVAFA